METKINVPYGCNRALPDGVRFAWGARMIDPADLLPDRQGCAGGEDGCAERGAVLNWLSSGAGDAAREKARELFTSYKLNGASQDVVTLYEDDRGVVKGSPQGSHGYLYVAAWLHEHVEQVAA